MKKQVFIGSAILGSLILGLAVGCGGLDSSTQTTAGGTESSTGSNQVIPKSVTISPTESSTSASGSKAAEQEEGESSRDGEYGFAIQMGEDLSNNVNEILDSILSLLTALEIPQSKELARLEKTIDVPSNDGEVQIPEEHRAILGKQVTVKVDFADFDLDSDGDKEGCSGTTAELPVCYRIWVNGAKTLAGVVQEFPGDTASGLGELRLLATSILGSAFEMGAVYNHATDGNKKTDLYGNGKVSENFGLKGGHIDALRDNTGKKTIKMSAEFSSYKGGLESARYIGQWLEEGTYWSGSLNIQPNDGSNIEGACAVRATGASVPQTKCLAENVDASEEEYTRLGTEADYGFPADMAEEPTF